MTTLMPTSAWVSIMELLPPLCHGAGISGCGASSGSSPRCAAWWRTHHAHSRFPKENGGSLRPQLEQMDIASKQRFRNSVSGTAFQEQRFRNSVSGTAFQEQRFRNSVSRTAFQEQRFQD